MEGFKAPPTKDPSAKTKKGEHPRFSIGFYKKRGDTKETYLMRFCKDKKLSEAEIMYKLFETTSPSEIHGKMFWYALEQLGLIDEKALAEAEKASS